MNGIKSQDIVVLLKLVSLDEQERAGGPPDVPRTSAGEDPYSVRNLEDLLGISKTEVNASINRSLSVGLAIRDRKNGRPKTNRRSLHSFVIHGLKYVFPAKIGALTRGIPTTFAAPMLRNLLISGGEYIYVWPFAEGRDLGQSLEPLFRSVPMAAEKDERLYEYLALVDAVRVGNQREAGAAADALSRRLLGT